ncbi:hypothetical protein HMPREF1141_1717 [Clostridium sp. MSTE9]|nr:hypothetical protein HMPREF1141_1717 [Clostridium sp. MSTE9]
MRNNIRIGSFLFAENTRAAEKSRKTRRQTPQKNEYSLKQTNPFQFSQDSHTNVCLFTPNSQALR